MKDSANTTTANDKPGDARTATYGALPYGRFVMDHEVRAHFATTVGTSTNATRSCRPGLSTSSTTSDHTTTCRHIGRSGKVLIRFPQHVRNMVAKDFTRRSVIQTKTARPDQVCSKCYTRIVAFISVAFSVLIVSCKQTMYNNIFFGSVEHEDANSREAETGRFGSGATLSPALRVGRTFSLIPTTPKDV